MRETRRSRVPGASAITHYTAIDTPTVSYEEGGYDDGTVVAGPARASSDGEWMVWVRSGRGMWTYRVDDLTPADPAQGDESEIAELRKRLDELEAGR